MKHHVVVIYDSIENSVFSGQVLTPLVCKLTKYPADRGFIISFERKMPSQKALAQFNRHPNIDYVILRKLPFLGTLSLRYAAYQLNRVLRNYTIHAMTARGPLAGWIVAHTPSLASTTCVIQARGLAAQEYNYEHDNRHAWFMQKLHQLRTYQYEHIERYVYGKYAQQPSVSIESVSASLREYVIQTFGTPSQKIHIQTADIPRTIDPINIHQWRTVLRQQIKIHDDTYVYVYNGSAKSWQCPEETIAYFVQQYTNNPHSFLLILTQDQDNFIALCTKYALPQHAYYITFVSHDVIYQYLAAADAGIIFRKPHIINWVSRPTKILEYQAVGLKIIHNNTVAMLTNHQT